MALRAFSAFADSRDDRGPVGAAGTRASPRKQVRGRGVPRDALELGERIIGQRHAGSRCARAQLAVDIVWDVAHLDRLHTMNGTATPSLHAAVS
jgi:hypothetical protein